MGTSQRFVSEGRQFALPHLVALHVRVGDEIIAHNSVGEPARDAEIYIRKPSLRRAEY